MTQHITQKILDKADITEEIVKRKLLEFKTDKSSGLDRLHPRILKETADVIVKPVEILFKKNLEQKELAQQWKDAVITSIQERNQILGTKLSTSFPHMYTMQKT